MLAPFTLHVAVFVLDEHTAHTHIAESEQHARLGGAAVAPGAADFLVIGLDAGRDIGMKHETHIRFVDTHAKRDGGNDNNAALGEKAVLVGGARLRVHPGVIGERGKTLIVEVRRRFLGFLARQAIDDAALALAVFETIE